MKLLLSLLLSMTLAPTAFANKADKAGKKGVKSASIEFSENAHTLTSAQKEMIKEKISGLKNKGSDYNIGIAGWSDQPYPGKEAELSEEAQDLASKRIEAVENYITDELNFEGSISTYNMAQQANWLARMFDTEGAELRSVFAKDAKVSDDTLRERFKAYQEVGGEKKVALVISSDKAQDEQPAGNTDQPTNP